MPRRPHAPLLLVSLAGACGEPPKPSGDVAPAEVHAPAPAEPAPVTAPVVAAPPPTPCRIVRASYRRAETGYTLERAGTTVAAATLADWSLDGAAAPPLFDAAALDGMKKTEHGTTAVNDAGLTIARDRDGRQALASVPDDAGATLTLYVYLYTCDVVTVDTVPTADEGSIPVPRYAATQVPEHPAPGAPTSGARKVRKGAEIGFDRSRVIVRTPAVAAVRSPSTRTIQVFDPATGQYGDDATLQLSPGGVLYLYADEGEGMCLLGDGATLGRGDCSDLAELVAEPFASLGPQPIESSWWIRLREKKSETWIEASSTHVDARERRTLSGNE